MLQTTEAYEQQVSLVHAAGSRTVEQIRSEQQQVSRKLKELEQELQTLPSNLYQHLQQALAPEQLRALNRLFGRSTMTLGDADFKLEPATLKAALAQWLLTNDRLALPGLHLQLDSLPAQHTQRTAAQLQQEQVEQQQRLASLSLQLQTAEEIEAAKRLKDELARERKKIDQELAAFDELQALRTSHIERENQGQELQLQREQLEDRLAAVGEEEERLRLSLHEHNAELSSLDDQHRSIYQLREARNDSANLFTYVHELPRHEWLAATDLSLGALANTLKEYQKDCDRLMRLEELARTSISELHVGGLSKYQQSENRDSEIRKMLEFARHLPQEFEAIERAARTDNAQWKLYRDMFLAMIMPL